MVQNCNEIANEVFFFDKTYRVVRQLWIIQKPLETSRNWPQWFPAGFWIVLVIKKFEKIYILIQKSETYWKPAAVFYICMST